MAGVVLLGKQVATPPATIGVSGIALGFAVLIVLGTVALSLPMSRAAGQRWDLLDAFFTATSAVCVTGLVVVDTATHWSTVGQGVILGLIQLGGLGVMTASMFILIILRRPISFRDRFELREASRPGNIRSVAGLLWATVLLTVVLEALGAAALWYRLGGLEGNPEALWFGVFHAISAFNNAGFDLTGNFASLAPFSGETVILLILALLAILGGFGALVLIDLLTKRSWKRLAPNSKMVLCTSGILLAVGFAGILFAEFANDNTLGALGLVDRLTNAFFHSAV
ncbi:MAG TPA: potassium transporter TrkG, partial [Dehalococcoidia bacterium]|nr:potassium transporter TrkG [Dehalococcoidia bacterium]